MSIEHIPRWWPGLFGVGEGVKWVRLNDDDPTILCDIPEAETIPKSTKLRRTDIVVTPAGEIWGCLVPGDFHTAQMVRAIRADI